MDKKNWMLITYYCPTHGDSSLIKPIEIKKNEKLKALLGRKAKASCRPRATPRPRGGLARVRH